MKQKRSKKTKIILATITCIILIIGCVVILEIDNIQNIFSSKNNKNINPMYVEGRNNFIFYDADYNKDIYKNNEYMDLDRFIYYSYGGETIATDTISKRFNTCVEFLIDYIKTIVNGDYERYNTFFSDDYYLSNTPYIKFTKQMLYDICLTQLLVKNESDYTRYIFCVEYKIFENNGTFRNDVDSDSLKPLYFEIIIKNEVAKINKISYSLTSINN